MKPFLKWLGGKHRVVPKVKQYLLPGKRLIEPFVGSGSVFLNTDYEEYLLADSNQDLIAVYQTLQEKEPFFIE